MIFYCYKSLSGPPSWTGAMSPIPVSLRVSRKGHFTWMEGLWFKSHKGVEIRQVIQILKNVVRLDNKLALGNGLLQLL